MAATRAVRIDLRATPELKELLQEAAAVSGVTLTAFVTQAAAASARDVLAQHRVITLSPAESQVLVEALRNPPEPTAALRALLAEPTSGERLREALEWLHREHGDVLQRLAQ